MQNSAADHTVHHRDSRSLENRARQEAVRERQQDREDRAKTVTDPLEPAQRNGNEPSRGAQIDAELQREDAEAVANGTRPNPRTEAEIRRYRACCT